jgi:hypothetical protein
MLHAFLAMHRETLIARCEAKVSRRTIAASGDAGLQHGVPLFLDQLVRTLALEASCDELRVAGYQALPSRAERLRCPRSAGARLSTVQSSCVRSTRSIRSFMITATSARRLPTSRSSTELR